MRMKVKVEVYVFFPGMGRSGWWRDCLPLNKWKMWVSYACRAGKVYQSQSQFCYYFLLQVSMTKCIDFDFEEKTCFCFFALSFVHYVLDIKYVSLFASVVSYSCCQLTCSCAISKQIYHYPSNVFNNEYVLYPFFSYSYHAFSSFHYKTNGGVTIFSFDF